MANSNNFLTNVHNYIHSCIIPTISGKGLDNHHHHHEECAAYTTLSITTDSSTNTSTTRTQDKCIQVYPISDCGSHVCHHHFMGELLEKDCEHSKPTKHTRVPMSEKERQRHREQKQRLRENPAYREAERLRNMLNKRKLRADPEYRMRERIKDKERKRSKRYMERMPDHERSLEIVLATSEEPKDHISENHIQRQPIQLNADSVPDHQMQTHSSYDQNIPRSEHPVQSLQCQEQPSKSLQRLESNLARQDHNLGPPLQRQDLGPLADHSSQPLQMSDQTNPSLQRSEHSVAQSMQDCSNIPIPEQNVKSLQDHQNHTVLQVRDDTCPVPGHQDLSSQSMQEQIISHPELLSQNIPRQDLTTQALQNPEPCLQTMQRTELTSQTLNHSHDPIDLQDSRNQPLQRPLPSLSGNAHHNPPIPTQSHYPTSYV